MMHIGRTVGLVSLTAAGVLAFEISLMRILLVASWHHYAFLVISIALLGFGVSGTLLCFLRKTLLRFTRPALFGLAMATAVSMPICASLLHQVEIESQVAAGLLWQQLTRWILLWAGLMVPFVLGAMVTALGLQANGQHVAAIYAGNLIGSGAGALYAPIMMAWVAPAWLPVLTAVPVLAGVICVTRFDRRDIAALICAVGITTAWTCWRPPHIRPDPYKYLAYVQRLVRQGSATPRAVAHSARGTVHRYSGPIFHEIPFLSVKTTPPPLDVLLIDGHMAGSVLHIDQLEQAAFLQQSLLAMPYALAPSHPRVLVLGASGGVNIWLAAAHHASLIAAVQPLGDVFDVMRGPRAPRSPQTPGGRVLELDNVHTITSTPRGHVEQSRQQYDIIQLAQLQSLPAGSSGMVGLAEDHLLTVEGISTCLRRLGPGGILFACRGIQTPPRDNLKLLATCVQALRRAGVSSPADHIAIVRDYLAVCTLVKAEPWRPEQIEQIRHMCLEHGYTPVWFPTVRGDELNHPDALPAAPYHHAAVQIMSDAASSFIDRWRFDIRSATDDRPFFFDFCRLDALGAIRQAYGPMWLASSELALPFVLASMALVGAAAILMTVLPMLLLKQVRCARGKGATAAFFTAIGLAYMLIEMAVLSKMVLLLGDPLLAAAITIGAFLVISGLGSLYVMRFWGSVGPRLGLLLLLLCTVGVVDMAALSQLAFLLRLPIGARCIVALAIIAPLAFLMGTPMPSMLAQLARYHPALIGWAWAVNGFASVFAAPAAIAIGMTWGYRYATATGIALYLVAAVVWIWHGGGTALEPPSLRELRWGRAATGSVCSEKRVPDQGF